MAKDDIFGLSAEDVRWLKKFRREYRPVKSSKAGPRRTRVHGGGGKRGGGITNVLFAIVVEEGIGIRPAITSTISVLGSGEGAVVSGGIALGGNKPPRGKDRSTDGALCFKLQRSYPDPLTDEEIEDGLHLIYSVPESPQHIRVLNIVSASTSKGSVIGYQMQGDRAICIVEDCG